MAFKNTATSLVIVGAPGSPQVIIDPSQTGIIRFLNPSDTAPNPATIGRDQFGAINLVEMLSAYFGAAGSLNGASIMSVQGQTTGGLAIISALTGAGAASAQFSVSGGTTSGFPGLFANIAAGMNGVVPIDGTGNAWQSYVQYGELSLGNSDVNGQYTLNYPSPFPNATNGIAVSYNASTSIVNSGLLFVVPNRFGATLTIRNSSTGANPGAGIGLSIGYVAFGH